MTRIKLVLHKTRPVRIPTNTKPLIFLLFGIIVAVAATGIMIAEAIHISYGPANIRNYKEK